MKLEITIDGTDPIDEIEIRYVGGRHQPVTIKAGPDSDLHTLITASRAMLGERETERASRIADGSQA